MITAAVGWPFILDNGSNDHTRCVCFGATILPTALQDILMKGGGRAYGGHHLTASGWH